MARLPIDDTPLQTEQEVIGDHHGNNEKKVGRAGFDEAGFSRLSTGSHDPLHVPTNQPSTSAIML